MAEAVLLSISPSYAATIKNSGNSTAELVTLEDLVETLFGLEIVDAADRAEDMQVLARQRWAERARGLGLDVDGVNQPIDPSQPEK